MIISVASGKGGTGKTTIAVNLAVSLGENAILLDCDVEEPNAHLFIEPELNLSIPVTTPVPEIDEKKCNLCGKCEEICQFKAIVLVAETVLTFPELCHSCGGCFLVCPENAIHEKARELGEIKVGKKDGLEMVFGKLRVGEAMSPPLIKQVRGYERTDKVTIIDAPPGTSCPVIAAMKDTDFVLLVTEPTPFGLHDLELAYGAVKILGIPCGLIINRADLGDDRVKKFAQQAQIPILMEIPFDRKIAEIYSRGGLLVKDMEGMKDKFLDLFDKIKEQVGSDSESII
ncbi:MAG: ATP-binding protein [Desulfobacterales bacterium]